MSDQIVKELPKWFVDRMREWARAILFPDGSDVPSSWPSDGPMNDSSGFGSRIPRMLGRAHDTDMALSPPLPPEESAECVEPRYAWAVRQFWLYEGRSLREHGRGRSINHETFGFWVRKGHEQLLKIFAVQGARWKDSQRLKREARESA